jgi:hypothetical protein
MTNTTRILTGLTLVAALGAPQIQAQVSANDQITASARVVTPITLTGGADLNLGAILAGGTSTVLASDANSGEFVVTGDNGAGIDIDWVLPTLLLNGGNDLNIDTYTVIRGDAATRATPITDNYAVGGAQSETATLGAGNYNLFIGADVTDVGPAEPAGLYTALIDLTVTYNGL